MDNMKALVTMKCLCFSFQIAHWWGQLWIKQKPVVELQSWISEWQKGKISARETGMKMTASKRVAFSNLSAWEPTQDWNNPIQGQLKAAELGLIWI